MANQVLLPPEIEEQTERNETLPVLHIGDGELHLTMQREASLWESLVANVRDVFQKPDLPPLELTSEPVAGLGEEVGKTKWSRGAIITSIVVNGLILAALIVFAIKKIVAPAEKPTIAVTDISDIKPYIPTFKGNPGGGGGGGGEHSPIPPPKGKLPDVSKEQMLPPTVKPPVVQPKLPVAPTVVADMKLPTTPLPNIGVPNGPAVASDSNGSGSGHGIGTGTGTGIGSGNGNGIGAGSGGNFGGGVRKPGGGVSNPELVYAPEAEFSDEARKNRYEGSVLVSLIVGPEGLPHNVRILRPLGMGLDEKAIAAVKQYKFKPAIYEGKAVPVQISVEVVFHIF